MLGAIAGDIIGSIYEWENIKTKKFPLFGEGCRFTDDTVCTIAIAHAIQQSGNYADYLGAYARRHPRRGYGQMFRDWSRSWDPKPYGSFGNGSAMRVAPVGFMFNSEDEVLQQAEASAAVTHNHPDAVEGAKAVAWAIWQARSGESAAAIRRRLEDRFDMDLSMSVDDIRPWYEFDITCAGTVPPALTCALEATGYEDAIRNAISIGGDSDTIACITGGVAEALFGLPEPIARKARSYLTDDLLAVLDLMNASIDQSDPEGPRAVPSSEPRLSNE